MIRWIKTGFEMKANGEQTITYDGEATLYQIQSRKRLVKNRKNNSMRLSNCYCVMEDGEDIAEKATFKDAKEFVEELRRGKIHDQN